MKKQKTKKTKQTVFKGFIVNIWYASEKDITCIIRKEHQELGKEARKMEVCRL